MPNIKKFATAVALSTALAGGAVGMGAATTVTSANATASVTASTNNFGGCGCCHRRCCGPNGHRIHRTTIKIFHHRPEVTWRNVRGCFKVFD